MSKLYVPCNHVWEWKDYSCCQRKTCIKCNKILMGESRPLRKIETKPVIHKPDFSVKSYNPIVHKPDRLVIPEMNVSEVRNYQRTGIGTFRGFRRGMERGMSGGVAEVGGAATGQYDPDGQVSAGDWWDFASETQSNLHLMIDDAIRTGTPATTGSNEEIRSYNVTEGVWNLEEVTGSITTVRIYAYCYGSSPGDTLVVRITANGGTNWTSTQNITPATGSWGWLYSDFTVSWSGTTDFRVGLNTTGVDMILVAAIYADINP